MNNNSISHSVNDWRNRNKDIVNADWDKDNTSRTQRFREFGQLEVARNKYNTKNPQKRLEQSEYLQKKQNKYPSLSVNVNDRQSIQRDSRTIPNQENTPLVRKPTVAIPGNYKAPVNEQSNGTRPEQNPQRQANIQNNNVNRQQQPANISPPANNNDSKERAVNGNVQQRPSASPKQTENFNQVRNAQQYHQNTWKQIQPQQQYNAPRPVQQENRRVEQPVRQSSPAPSNNRRK